MMAHVKTADRWEEGKPTPVPLDAKIRAHGGGGKVDAFFTTVYVDDYLLIIVQHLGLASFRSRASVRAGRDRRYANINAQKKHRLGHHDRRSDFHHRLAHYENLVDSRKKRSQRKAAAQPLADEQTSSESEGRPQHGGEVVESHVRSTRRQVFCMETVLRLTGLHDERDRRNQNLVGLWQRVSRRSSILEVDDKS